MIDKISAIKKLISRHKSDGNLFKALECTKNLIDIQKELGKLSVDDLMQATVLAFSVCDYKWALSCLNNAESLEPTNGLIKWNKVQLLTVIDQANSALDVARIADELLPSYKNKNEVMARIYGRIGDHEKARFYGEKSLLDADLNSRGVAFSLPDAPPKPFDPTARERNIISFSLWGDKRRYIDNAIENGRLRKHFYPEWTLRFYVEEASVNIEVVKELRNLDCEVILMPKQKLVWEGLFWRMHVINNPNVDRFLQRDVDSVFSVKERLAVDEWLSSDKYFHVMRDHYAQTDLIQAGLWGGCSNVLPKLNTLLKMFRLHQPPSRMVDQQFLSGVVWPTVRQSVLIHDSNFKAFEARNFPRPFPVPPGGYLGANAGDNS